MNTTWSKWMCQSLNGTWLNCGRTSYNMTGVRGYNNHTSLGGSWDAQFSNISSYLNFINGSANDTLAQNVNNPDLLGLFPSPSSAAAGGMGLNSNSAMDLSSSYTVVIIILSLLVLITILFTLCILFMKALAHSSADIHRGTGDTLFFTDKDSALSMFSLQDDV